MKKYNYQIWIYSETDNERPVKTFLFETYEAARDAYYQLCHDTRTYFERVEIDLLAYREDLKGFLVLDECNK